MSVTHRRSVSAAAAAIVIALTTFAVASAAVETSPSAVVPGSESQAALSALAVASTPQPLPGSLSVSATAHRYTGGCDALRAAYQAPDAPVPTGSVVSVVPDGGLRFDAPFGPSAVFVRDDADGACTYEIRSMPTIVIEGPDVPGLNGFFTLSCFEPFSVSFLAVAEIAVVGEPIRTLTIGQDATLGGSAEPEPFTLSWYPATAAELVATNAKISGAMSFERLSGVYDAETRSGTVSGSGATGPIEISFQCTVGNFVIPGL